MGSFYNASVTHNEGKPKSNIKGDRKKKTTEKVKAKNNKGKGHILMTVIWQNVEICKEIILWHLI